MAKKPRFRDIKKGNISDKQDKDSSIKSYINYAPIGLKIKAFITDLFMLLMPIMYIVVYLVIGSLQEFREHRVEGWLYILIPNFIVIFLFFWKSGQTPGCKAYEIELVDSKTLKKPHPLAIILRYYFEIFSIISIFGLLMAFFRDDKKSLHDLLSGTVIINTNQNKTLN